MVTPEFLEGLDTSKLAKIYGELNINIVASIIKRILEIGRLDSFSKSQIKTVIELGGQEIFELALEETSLLNSQVKDEVKNTYMIMAQQNMKGYKYLYKYLEKEYKMSASQVKILNGAIKRTNKTLTNLTKTIAFSSEKLFIEAMDKAYFQVITGGRDYISVIEDTTRALAKQGVTLQDSIGRNIKIDVAVRQNLLTGIKDTADEINQDIEEELGCNGYEVTSHSGARPSHAKAQGKQYAKTRADARKYGVGYWGDVEDLWKEYNCRHTYFGIILGASKPVYTKKELSNFEKAKVTYNGKTMTEYEGTQIQRQLEREQRELRRIIQPLEKNNQNVKDLKLRLQQKQSEYKDFCKQTGLTPQYERTKVI